MKNTQIAIIVFSATLLTSVLFAAAAHAQSTCKGLECRFQTLNRRSLTPIEVSQLPADLKANLENKAYELAQIWGDTILEGDYYAADEAQMDKVEIVYDQNQKVGYRITYSAQAWDTSTCHFDSRDLQTLNDCLEGRIVESGYVTSDFVEAFQDRSARARFEGSR